MRSGETRMNPPGGDLAGASQSMGRRGVWRVWALLLVGLGATALVARFTKADVDGDAKREFAFVGDEIQGRIQDRLRAHEQILRSGAAFFEHAGGVSRQEWRRFTERQKVEQELPGIQGLGFALVIPRERLARHVQEIRAEGFPAYEVRPKAEREIYSSIIYLEPFTNRNLRAFGYDMFSEPVRRTAMERARDQDAAALSGKVILMQENELETGPDLWRRLLHPEDLERANRIVTEAISEKTSLDVEVRLLHKEGHYVPIHTCGFVVRDPGGKPVRVSGTNTDLTERKKLEEERRQWDLQERPQAFLSKPYEFEELRQALARVLETADL